MTFCKLEDWGNFRNGILVQKIEHAESFEYFGKNQITYRPLLTDLSIEEIASKFDQYAKDVGATHISISGVNSKGFFREDCFLFLLRDNKKWTQELQ